MNNKLNIPTFESQMGQIQEARKMVEELKIASAVADNELSNKLYEVTHEEKHDIQIHEGYYVSPTDWNWADYTNDKYERTLYA